MGKMKKKMKKIKMRKIKQVRKKIVTVKATMTITETWTKSRKDNNELVFLKIKESAFT